MFLKDTNGDDKYDTKEIVLHGFDSADTHHAINSFTFDPGGALYLQEGIFHRTRSSRRGGRSRGRPTAASTGSSRAPGSSRPTSRSTSRTRTATSSTSGAATSCSTRPAASRTTGRRSRPRSTTRRWRPSTAPKPGDVRTRPVGGAEILSSRHFPEEMQGNLIVLNTIGFQGLLNYKLSEDGAGLKSTEVEPILSSADENFRPVDAEVGPDGALYFADWHNPIIGHMQHNLRDTSRDHAARPRLSRDAIRAGRCSSRQRSPAQPIPQLLDLLKEPENRVRYRAKIELSARDTKEVLAALQAWIARLDPKDPALRAPHDGSALGAPVAQPGQREAADADAQVERPVGARRRDARALLLARPRRQSAGAAEDAGHRPASRLCASKPCAPRASSRRRKRPRSRSRRSPSRRIASSTTRSTRR